MRLEEFDFDLPERLIAVRPLHPRSAARLLVVAGGTLRDAHVRDLPDLLRPGDRLVFNDTRVIPARLQGLRQRPGAPGARVEILLAEPLAEGRWAALARPLKKLRPGDRLLFSPASPGAAGSAAPAPAAAELTAPDQAGPLAAAPDHPAPDHPAPDHPAPDHAAPDHAAPGPDAAGRPAPEQAGPFPAAPDPAASNPADRTPLTPASAAGGGTVPPVLAAEVLARGPDRVELAFDCTGPAFEAALAAAGAMPLPPYIAARRAPDARDRQDYQTIFARSPGAVAAPTAALHFDAALMAALAARGIDTTTVTLHVGAGTFLPVKVDDIARHRMHAERGCLSATAAGELNATRAAGGRIIAVGTTALRLLETAADAQGRFAPWQGATDIFIRPGHRFRGIDALMTNFHLPRSTLLMLVAALAGHRRILDAYAHAVAQGYRFFSYGDASLLFPDDTPAG